jgi:hypothetical protein
MKNLEIVNGMAWKGVNTIKEAYAMWNMGYEPHVMTNEFTFDVIETADDMDSVIESHGKSVYFNMGEVSAEQCMNEAKRVGNVTDADVTNINFVKNLYSCTDAQAYAALWHALTSNEVRAEVIKELDKMNAKGFDRATGWANE